MQSVIRTCKLPGIYAEGVYTHFAVSDYTDSESIDYTKKQFELFMHVINDAERLGGFKFKIRHCANSGAVVNHPEMMLDMVRPGFLLYGYGDDGKLGLKPAMRMVSTVSTIKYYEPGTCVSYGRHYVTDKRTRMGVVAAGYAEVEIFGENARIEKLAEAAGTIPYELLCAVSKRVPRIYK